MKKLKPPRSKRKMMVAVAKDVLKLMRYLKLRQRSYLKPDTYGVFDKYIDKEIQPHIPAIAKKCEVCARGALVLAHAHLYDACVGVPDNYDTEKRSFKLFGRQGTLIEAAFEMDSSFATSRGYYSPETAIKASDFGANYRDKRDRLRAIMKNIVKNKGAFRP